MLFRSSVALAVATVPSASAGADPIFAAIEVHKAARVRVYAAIDANNLIETQIIGAGKRLRDSKDNPEYVCCENALDVAHDAETDAACALVNILPTTIAGVIALLSYAHSSDTDGEGWPELATDDGPKARTRSWQFFLIQNLAEILPGMVSA